MLERSFAEFPWSLRVTDWTGASYSLGRGEPHWDPRALEVTLHTPAAGGRILASDAAGFLVKSHYDIPQEALDVYLDRVYLAYSCGMFEQPLELDREEALRVGSGRHDDFDSLEKSQWRKFQDAIDFVDPAPGDEVLDIGCGYGGQLAVALESHSFRRYVGWTHSRNQVEASRKLLAPYDASRWEVREGDYRQDTSVYDHVTSTGMVSHVGPRGLVPYVRQVRRRIERGGRYLHHALMRPYSRLPFDLAVGPAFNKRYVWPGFHWFCFGEHVRALEANGFEILGSRNLTAHYAKTTMSWYERMMAGADVMRRLLGEPTLRAWRIYLAGGTSGLQNHGVEVHRIYCRAV
jgi:cyclopropane fatty-acyl-phospholipid synthase-like methyltransferase